MAWRTTKSLKRVQQHRALSYTFTRTRLVPSLLSSLCPLCTVLLFPFSRCTHILVSFDDEPPTTFWTRSEASSVRSSTSWARRSALFLDWSSKARLQRQRVSLACRPEVPGGRDRRGCGHGPGRFQDFQRCRPGNAFKICTAPLRRARRRAFLRTGRQRCSLLLVPPRTDSMPPW